MAARRHLSLTISFALGVVALVLAGVSLIVADRAMLLLLALGACAGTVALLFAIVSFGSERRAPSIAALVSSLLVLSGIGLGYGAISVRTFVRTIDEQRPSAAEHVDRDYRFRVRAPSYDDSVFDGESAPHVNRRALAGVWLADDELTMLVFVERRYGRSLAVAAEEEAALSGERLGEPWGAPQRVRFLGRDAVRVRRVAENDDGSSAWEEHTIFMHQDRVYDVQALRNGNEVPSGDPWFPQALEAFELLPGRVRDRFTPARIASDDGAGYRVRDHVYQDLDWGVRVRAEGASLFYGEAARDFGGENLAVVEQRNPDVLLAIRALAIGGRDPNAVAAEMREDFAQTATTDGRAIERTVAGRAITFSADRSSPDRTWHYRHGVWTDDERAIEIIVYAPTMALTDAHLDVMLERIEIVRPARASAEWDDVGFTWWIRGGAFHDEESGARWTRPDARWRAAAAYEGGIARIEAPSLGLTGRIVEHPLEHVDDARAAHVSFVGELFEDPPEPEEHDGVLLTTRLRDGEFTWAIATIAVEGYAVHAEIWGTVRDYDRHEADVIAAARGLSWDDIATSGPNDHVSERLGYRFRHPWRTEGSFDGSWPTLDDDVGTLEQYSRATEIVGVFAARRDATMSARAQRDLLMRRYYAYLLESPGRWSERRARLGGRPATLRERAGPFGLGGTSIYSMEHRRILYVLVIDHQRGVDPARVARGFTLLP